MAGTTKLSTDIQSSLSSIFILYDPEMCIRDRLGKVVGHQNGKVGVRALLFLEAVAVDHGKVCLLYTSRCV